VAADAVSAVLLRRLSRAYAASKGGSAAAGGSSWGCALLFLWNPCAIAACVGCALLVIPKPAAGSLTASLDIRRRGWGSLDTVFVLTGAPLARVAAAAAAAALRVCASYRRPAALCAALERRPAWASLGLVCATYLSLYPVVLVRLRFLSRAA